MRTAAYTLVQLPNGKRSLHSTAYAETMHPGLGPAAEADALYVEQLKLRERSRRHSGEFVVWDIGLGAAANSLSVLRAFQDAPCNLRLVSFDHSLEPLEFGFANRKALGYFEGCEEWVSTLLKERGCGFEVGRCQVRWELRLGDFPKLLADPEAARLPIPDAILFDAFSPARNPEMWTLPLFANLFGRLEPSRPCALATYSRSTMVRVALLLAGFFVGRGQSSGAKEETTIAANTLELIEHPLDRAWLVRARKSGSAEPLTERTYRQSALLPGTWEKLQAHPQFC